MYNYNPRPVYPNELYHHGIKGQKKGIRRYQYPDGSLTPEGRKRYYEASGNLTYNRKLRREFIKGSYKDYKKTTDKSYREGYKKFEKDSRTIKKNYRAAKKGASKEKKEQLRNKLINDLLKVESAYNRSVNATRASLEKKYGKKGIDFLHKRRVRNKYMFDRALSDVLDQLVDKRTERNPFMTDSDRLRRENRERAARQALEARRAARLAGGLYDQPYTYVDALTKYSRKYRNHKTNS